MDCLSCSAIYPVIEGIPDFRISIDFWLDAEHDRERAREFAKVFAESDIEGLVRRVFSEQPSADPGRTALRTSQVLQAPNRLQREIEGWLDAATHETPFLEIGCGPGMLLAAAASKGRNGIGIDASLVWLLVAKRLILAWGGKPLLAAGLADALPLASESVGAAIALDVIEHVADPGILLRELSRVTQPGGYLALATPNRYSLTAEPHVKVWGVGLVPRRWQADYVRWRSGKPYEYTCLLSTWETLCLVRRYTAFQGRILIPRVADEEILRFTPARGALARLYNRLTTVPLVREVFRWVGPFFRVVGTRVR